MPKLVTCFKNIERVKLISLELYSEHEPPNTKYYLKAVYEVKNKRGIYNVTIPKIKLGIVTNTMPYISYLNCERDPEKLLVDIGFGNTFAEEVNGNFMTESCVEETVRDVTIEDIETQLGYKVRIVSE